MENIYPEGSTVFAKTDPSHPLQVRRFVKRIYYCTDPAKPSAKDQVFYERELMTNDMSTSKT